MKRLQITLAKVDCESVVASIDYWRTWGLSSDDATELCHLVTDFVRKRRPRKGTKEIEHAG